MYLFQLHKSRFTELLCTCLNEIFCYPIPLPLSLSLSFSFSLSRWERLTVVRPIRQPPYINFFYLIFFFITSTLVCFRWWTIHRETVLWRIHILFVLAVHCGCEMLSQQFVSQFVLLNILYYR